jgi:hypothetical protein
MKRRKDTARQRQQQQRQTKSIDGFLFVNRQLIDRFDESRSTNDEQEEKKT